ncbi:hypothetical protein NPIL_549201 [Nephila pilipes]|uniref:Uncharacterized protein n=1 Tax=Nephila pilipes TaxID=299642 RepID=A0A8X6NVN3_NEPPI|nr:hypothetical protein NPIL_549201 [Nephila pilipes]
MVLLENQISKKCIILFKFYWSKSVKYAHVATEHSLELRNFFVMESSNLNMLENCKQMEELTFQISGSAVIVDKTNSSSPPIDVCIFQSSSQENLETISGVSEINTEKYNKEYEGFSLTRMNIKTNSKTAKCRNGCLQVTIEAKEDSEDSSNLETNPLTQKPLEKLVLKNCSSQNLVYEITPVICDGNHIIENIESEEKVQKNKTRKMNGGESSESKDGKNLKDSINVTFSSSGNKKLKTFHSKKEPGTVQVRFIYKGKLIEIDVPPKPNEIKIPF